jgi:hypothetical protein
MQVNVLALSDCDGDLCSAQLVFNGNRRLQTLDCARTLAEAARFLSAHPGALILCEERPQGLGQSELISRLISEGSPAALITIKRESATCESVEVLVYRDHDVLHELLDGDVLRAIAVAWQYCEETSQEGGSPAPKSEKLPVM